MAVRRHASHEQRQTASISGHAFFGPESPGTVRIVSQEDFLPILKSVFDSDKNREGNVWLFNNDLNLIEDHSFFESVYKGFILPRREQIKSIRFILPKATVEKLEKGNSLLKRNFQGVSDEDLARFQVRLLSDVQRRFPDLRKLLGEHKDLSFTFYTIGHQINHDDAVMILRPKVHHSQDIKLSFAGTGKMWRTASFFSDAAYKFEKVFIDHDDDDGNKRNFSKLVRGDGTSWLRFEPPIFESRSQPTAISQWNEIAIGLVDQTNDDFRVIPHSMIARDIQASEIESLGKVFLGTKRKGETERAKFLKCFAISADGRQVTVMEMDAKTSFGSEAIARLRREHTNVASTHQATQETLRVPEKEQKKVRNKAGDLNRQLKTQFGIQESPFSVEFPNITSKIPIGLLKKVDGSNSYRFNRVRR